MDSEQPKCMFTAEDLILHPKKKHCRRTIRCLTEKEFLDFFQKYGVISCTRYMDYQLCTIISSG